MSFEIDVQSASRSIARPDDETLARWAREVLAAHSESAALSIRLVEETEGRMLNARYRGGSGATNVLSFPFEAGPLTDPPLLGDVVICTGVVEREALEQGKALPAHYAHMVVHGVLHLLGYDHDDGREAARMEALEKRHLRALGFDDPYLAEARG